VQNLDLLPFLVHIVKGDIINAVPPDLLPRHPLTVDQFHGIRPIRFEVLFFVLIVNAVTQLHHQLGGRDPIPLEGTVLQLGWIV
ncbi:acyl carrier protein, partial [Dysosmobacter welbionis]